MITSLDDKIALMKHFGVNHIVIQPFTIDFSKMEYEDFVKNILVEKLGVKTLVIGYDQQDVGRAVFPGSRRNRVFRGGFPAAVFLIRGGGQRRRSRFQGGEKEQDAPPPHRRGAAKGRRWPGKGKGVFSGCRSVPHHPVGVLQLPASAAGGPPDPATPWGMVFFHANTLALSAAARSFCRSARLVFSPGS